MDSSDEEVLNPVEEYSETKGDLPGLSTKVVVSDKEASQEEVDHIAKDEDDQIEGDHIAKDEDEDDQDEDELLKESLI